MASPSSLAGYPNRQLTTPPLPTPLPFGRVPGQAPTIIGLRYKEEPPRGKSRLPISLPLSPPHPLRLGSQSTARKSVACFRDETHRLDLGTTRRGVSAASRLEWHLVDHSGYVIRQPLRFAADGDRLFPGLEKQLGGEKKSGPMSTQTRPSDRFSLSLGGIKGECISSTTKTMIIQPRTGIQPRMRFDTSEFIMVWARRRARERMYVRRCKNSHRPREFFHGKRRLKAPPKICRNRATFYIITIILLIISKLQRKCARGGMRNTDVTCAYYAVALLYTVL